MSAAAATPPVESTADQPAVPEQASSVGEAGPGTPIEPAALDTTEPGPGASSTADANGSAALEPAVDGADADAADASSATAATAPETSDGAPVAPAKTPELSPAACAAALAQHFPALFGTGVVLPVKLRIQVDIQQRAPGVFSRKSLSLFLHRHTTSTAYIRGLLAATQRFDLDGQPAGDISEEHRAAAVVELDRRKAIMQERRAAQRQQQPQPGRPGRDQAQRPPRPTQPQPTQPQDTDPAQAGMPAMAGDPAALQQPNAPRPAHTPRPPHPGLQRRSQGPLGDGARTPQAHPSPQGRGGERGPRAPRPGGRDEPRGARPDRNPRADGRDGNRPRPDATPRPAHAANPVAAPTQASAMVSTGDPVADAARRERSALLRTFESSTLTKANFLVLKRMTEAELDAQLAQARQERQAGGAGGGAPRDERPGRR